MRPAILLLLLGGVLPAASGCNPEARVAKAERDACEGGDAAACHAFAPRLEAGEHVLRDRERAAELLALACGDGHAESCAALGGMVQSGRGVERDSARAAALDARGGGAVFETTFAKGASGEGLCAFVTHAFADVSTGAVSVIRVGSPKVAHAGH